MNPVLTPKRKQYGFLKPPSARLPLLIQPNMSPSTSVPKESNNFLNKKCFNMTNYNFDSLPFKQESTRLADRYPNQSRTHMHRISNRSVYDLNISNRLRDHSVLRLPICVQIHNSSMIKNSNYLNKIDATQIVQQLIKGHRDNSIIYENCQSCVYETSRCFSCRENYSRKVSWVSNSITRLSKNNTKNLNFKENNTQKSSYF